MIKRTRGPLKGEPKNDKPDKGARFRNWKNLEPLMGCNKLGNS